MLQTLNVIGLTMLLPVALASAQAVRPIPQIAPGATVERALEKVGQAAIRGVAVDAGSLRVANAKVQLRNLITGAVEHVGMANQLGEFSFVASPEIPYVVEVTDVGGRVVAVGAVIVARAGDVAAATIALPTRVAMPGIFTETAGSVVSAATNLGIPTIQTTVFPFVSPEK